MRRRLLSLVMIAVFVVTSGVAAAQTPVGTPEANQLTVGGPGVALIPQGESGKVAVVASGQLQDSTIPLIVRNNTDKPVTDIEVKVEARDSSGTLIGVGAVSPSYSLKPNIVQPGGIAIGFAILKGDIPADTTLKYSVRAGEVAGGRTSVNVDLGVVEASWFGDRIVGTLHNPSNQALGTVYLNFICVDAAGTPFVADPSNIDGTIDPEGDTSFQIDGSSSSRMGDCENFIVAGYAHPE